MTEKGSRPSANGLSRLRGADKRLLLLAVALLLISIGIFIFVYTSARQQTFGVLDESILVQIPVDELPADTLYITQERRYYQRGAMTLIIPSIDVFTPVGESTTEAGLQEMPGMYEFSQLPGEGDVNVSIAGHRDIHDMVFYYLHEVNEGDCAYLIYEDTVYRYIYVDSKVVSPTEWDVIKPQGFSCMTLTTCDPIGTNLNRLILRWELEDYEDYEDDYKFDANIAALSGNDDSNPDDETER